MIPPILSIEIPSNIESKKNFEACIFGSISKDALASENSFEFNQNLPFKQQNEVSLKISLNDTTLSETWKIKSNNLTTNAQLRRVWNLEKNYLEYRNLFDLAILCTEFKFNLIFFQEGLNYIGLSSTDLEKQISKLPGWNLNVFFENLLI